MYQIDKEKFGAFVAQLRKEKGYTQKELAQLLFISDKAVSKWETGQSIPDTSLLLPLAHHLDVTVTELLMCERQGREEVLDPERVEDLVLTAVSYSKEKEVRAWQVKSWWKPVYFLSMLAGALGLWLGWLVCGAEILVTGPTFFGLAAIFGVYFCFFVPERLRAYYDENMICCFSDGPVRMNVPGIHFNNMNWPHVVRVCRTWCCVCMALYPVADLLAIRFLAQNWYWVGTFLPGILMIAGLFIPIYVVGRKYA